MVAVWKEVEHAFQTAAGRIHFHHENARSPEMTAALSDVQQAFNDYVAAVDAKLAELSADTVDLDPLAQSIADASAALNPAPVDPAV